MIRGWLSREGRPPAPVRITGTPLAVRVVDVKPPRPPGCRPPAEGIWTIAATFSNGRGTDGDPCGAGPIATSGDENEGGRMSAITERVERGAALLDEKRPGWWKHIDLDQLDIGSRCGCVIGQLAGLTKASDRGLAYEAATRRLGVGYSAEIPMGFEAPTTREFGGDRETVITAEYAGLTEAWRDLITRRRELAAVPA